MTVASRFVKLSHSFKLKVLECGHLILSKILTIIFNLARSLVKALLGCPPLSWAFEGWVGVWSQSTVVRGKLSLGKERKWEDTRRTQFTHRGIFGGRGNSHIGDIWRQKHRAVCKEVDRLTEEKQRYRVRR